MKQAASPGGCEASCLDCAHFEDDPARIEAALPGIGILGSAYGSSRGNAGICCRLGRFHDPIPAATCSQFEARGQNR